MWCVYIFGAYILANITLEWFCKINALDNGIHWQRKIPTFVFYFFKSHLPFLRLYISYFPLVWVYIFWPIYPWNGSRKKWRVFRLVNKKIFSFFFFDMGKNHVIIVVQPPVFSFAIVKKATWCWKILMKYKPFLISLLFSLYIHFFGYGTVSFFGFKSRNHIAV